MSIVFKKLNPFGRIHHGYLNNIEYLKSLLTHCGKYSDFVEIAEGDVCWLEEDGKVNLVMMHPKIFNNLPSIAEFKDAIQRKKLITLDEILELDLTRIILILELKNGYGNLNLVIKSLVNKLEKKISGRYWIDAFSPNILKIVKKYGPNVATSLHTRLGVYGQYVVRTTFDFPYISFLNIYKLSFVDTITISYKYSPAKIFKIINNDINFVNRHVVLSGKNLIFGGVDDFETFSKIKETNAIAAYLKFNKEKYSIPYK